MKKPPEAIDLDDPEQLAEAAMLGAVIPDDVSPAQLARLGRTHTELIARLGQVADKAQVQTLELESAHKAALREIEQLRAVNRAVRALVRTGKINSPVATELEAVELVVDTASLLAGTDANAQVVLLVGALSQVCLRHPGGADAFDAAVDSLRSAQTTLALLRVQAIEVPS